MAINRREFLSASSAITATALLPTIAAARNSNGFIVGASRLSKTQFAVSKVDLTGRLQWQTELPGRGHDVAINESLGIGVAVARRPGNFLLVFDLVSGAILDTLTLSNEVKLNGHAIWYNDTLIVSAANRVTSNMQLHAFYFNKNRQKLLPGETAYYEYTGPHELVTQNNTLWVAVGGLKTQGREVLNKSNFQSGLLRIDARTLEEKTFYAAPYSGISLRHLDAMENRIVIAGQYQLTPSESPPLLYQLDNEKLKPFNAESKLWVQLKGYIGSVKFVGSSIVATSPRAHWMGTFDPENFKLANQVLSSDICALANFEQKRIAGSGQGKLLVGEDTFNSKVVWDNHFAFSYV